MIAAAFLFFVGGAILVVAGSVLAAPAHAQVVGEIPAVGILVQTNGTHVTIDWQDAQYATRYLVQIYAGSIIADSLFVPDSVLTDKELRPGIRYTITATPYVDFAAGVERQLAVTRVDDAPPAPTPDQTAPVIALNGGDVTLAWGQAYTDQGATCTDDRDGSLPVTASGSVDIYASGTYAITYNCTDAAGNQATATRTVVVTAQGSPTITIRGPASVEVPQGSAYVDQGAVCTDSEDPSPVLRTSSPVDTSSPGTYSVTYTCTDSDGNTVAANRAVTVAAADTTAPVITLNGAPSVSVALGGAYSEPGAACVDDTDPRPALRISGAVDVASAGSYTLVYTCTDASGNVATELRTVTVTAPPPSGTTTPADAARLAAAVDGLADVIESLVQKIAALEAKITQQGAPFADEGDFVPIYYNATGPYNQVQKSYYEDKLFLENFTGRLTQTLALPYDVYLTMGECGVSNAYYQPDRKRIIVCYEYVTFLENVLDPYYGTDAELFEAVDEFVTWVVLHELGHALVDVYGLPITGNEEDAVDQFATVIALEYIPYGQLGGNLFPILQVWHELRETQILPTERQLGGPHSLSSQRFYNVACWMYGSDAHAYSSLAGLLPEARAGGCQSEYELLSESWYELASPFLLNPGSVPPP